MPIVDLATTEDHSGLVPLWRITIEDYHYVLYSGQKALVFKGESSIPAYEITSTGCNCQAAMYGNANCKHRQAISWVGDGGFTPPSPVEKAGNTPSELDTILDLL